MTPASGEMIIPVQCALPVRSLGARQRKTNGYLFVGLQALFTFDVSLGLTPHCHRLNGVALVVCGLTFRQQVQRISRHCGGLPA